MGGEMLAKQRRMSGRGRGSVRGATSTSHAGLDALTESFHDHFTLVGMQISCGLISQ